MSESADARFRRALAVFDEIAELDDDMRERRLLALCADDAALMQQVRALLAADAATAEPFAGATGWSAALAEEPVGSDRLLGQVIGAWRVVDVIGHGGMGAVYRVERGDGAYTQRAALKLIRAGADSPAARERFLRERQTLAQLQHENIATLLDGGFSAEGDPYFVMEYVDGVPIDQWCDARRLDLRARVQLFGQVLDAVSYAHRNLVVHRDLKPSNLLVDAEGRVRLLDFGIAKQLQSAEATATHDRALTFEYASPEQLHDAPVTTATDLWQLGVVLHRLLAGPHPFGLSRDTPVASQLQQLEREPEPLTRAAAKVSAEQAGLRGGLSPASLSRALRGSLADIVQVCLRRDPETRYASADAAASDLRAWLENRPISAVRLSRGTRAQLWLKRNRALAASIVVVVFTLLAGTGVAAWQAREARKQAAIAQRESANARLALGFLTDTLVAAAPAHALNTQVSVRQLLDHARAGLDKRSAVNPEVRQPVQRMLGNLYNALGERELAAGLYAAGLKNVQVDSRDEALALASDLDGYSSALGVLERSGQSLAAAQQAADLRHRFAPDDLHQRFLSERQVAVAYASEADCGKGKAQWTRALQTAGMDAAASAEEVADAHVAFAKMLFDCGQHSAGYDVARAGTLMAERRGLPPQSPLRASLLWVESLTGFTTGKLSLDRSEAMLRQAISIQQHAVGSGGSQMAEFHSTLGTQLQAAGRMAEALAAHEKSAEQSRISGVRPIDQAITEYNIGHMYVDYGDYAKALEHHRRSLDILAKAGIDPDHIEYRRARKWYARALIYAGDPEQARTMLAGLLERSRAIDGEKSMEYMDINWQLLRLAVAQRDLEHGKPLLDTVQKELLLFVPSTHPAFIELKRFEGYFALWGGDDKAAESSLREVIARSQAQGGLGLAASQADLAVLLNRQGRTGEARALLVAAMPVLRTQTLPKVPVRIAVDPVARALGV